MKFLSYNPNSKFNLTLFIDAFINIVLGLLLLPASAEIAEFIGVPAVKPGFYPSILGAVLFGIGIALLIESMKTNQTITGLGLYGAVAINICGGIVLAIWLLFGKLDLPLKGYIFLWILVFLLIILSAIEVIKQDRRNKNTHTRREKQAESK